MSGRTPRNEVSRGSFEGSEMSRSAGMTSISDLTGVSGGVSRPVTTWSRAGRACGLNAGSTIGILDANGHRETSSIPLLGKPGEGGGVSGRAIENEQPRDARALGCTTSRNTIVAVSRTFCPIVRTRLTIKRMHQCRLAS